MVIECQVVPASAAEWEEELVPGIHESRKDLTFSPVPNGYWIPMFFLYGQSGQFSRTPGTACYSKTGNIQPGRIHGTPVISFL